MSLSPGAQLGPYEILALIGAGGMGEVYRARDTRLDRQVAIKTLPRQVAADPERSARFEREARLLAALNHPHIVTIHSVERIEDVPFLTMELVEGRPLSALIPPGGFPIPALLRIAIPITDALAAAHQRGVTHRDLKPANVMVTPEGWVKVLDFGLAKLCRDAAAEATTTQLASDGLTADGRIVGTVDYMSPEQAEGQAIDHRSDLFSLGVMLYELATGHRPFRGGSPISVLSAILKDTPRSVTELNPAVPPELARVVRRCLEKDPTARFQSALDVRHELEDLEERLRRDSSVQSEAIPLPERRARRGARQIVALWLAPILLLLGVAAWVVLGGGDLRPALWFPERPALALGERDTVLLGEIENSTGDPALEGSIGTALEISLEQSPQVRLLAPDRVRQALRRMRRSEDEKLTPDLAREICQREGSRAVITGSVTRIGDNYMLTVRIIDPSTGTTVRTLTERADSRDQILPALDKLATSVRRLLGESLASIAAANVKLAEATTRSLEALKSFSEGSILLDRGRRDDAQARLTRAVELDPEFALAHAALASTYRGYGFHLDDAKAEHHFQEALKRLDRVSERERLEIQALYEGVMGHYENAAFFHRQLVGRYPNDAGYHFALAQDYRSVGRPRDAVTEAERALHLNPSSPRILVNLAATHGDLREWSRTVGYYERAFGVEPGLVTDLIINHQYGWALVEIGRQDAARAAFQKMLELEPAKRARGHRSLAILALYEGRLGEARRQLEEARRLDETSGTINSAARDIYYLVEGLVLLGSTQDANSLLARAADLSAKAHWTALSLRLATLLARNGRYGDASRIIASNRKQAQAGDPYERSDLLRTDGELALAQGKTAEALELLKQAAAIQPWILTQTSLARAMARSGKQEEAMAAFETVVARGPEPWEGQVEWAVSHLALARLYERAGRVDDARRTCEHLREVWKNADADLPPVRELSTTLARLGGARQPASAPSR
jgi:tetratricopeptide (TPR) repeat protein/tRNA A-37 threonylcarbamoyl transferase component Bud32